MITAVQLADQDDKASNKTNGYLFAKITHCFNKTWGMKCHCWGPCLKDDLFSFGHWNFMNIFSKGSEKLNSSLSYMADNVTLGITHFSNV